MTRKRLRQAFLATSLVMLIVRGHAAADSWPNDRGRVDRSGVAEESLHAPLALAWTHQAAQTPRPAFRGGTRYPDRQPDPITYDHAFRLVADDGLVFHGSSADDSIVCLDARTGKVQWRFFTAGPVRLAPTLSGGKLYAGSDDGYVYCLEPPSGRELWRFRAAPGIRSSIGNGRLISAWPVRTGVTVLDGTCYFAAGVLPTQGVYLSAVDAATGNLVWQRKVPYAANGQILPAGDRLLLPTGRTCPGEFLRADGTPVDADPPARRSNGSSDLRTIAGMVAWGACESGMFHFRVIEPPPDVDGVQRRSPNISGTFNGIEARDVVAGDKVFVLRNESIQAFDAATFKDLLTREIKAQVNAGERTRKGKIYAGTNGYTAGGSQLAESPMLTAELANAAAWSTPLKKDYRSLLSAGELLVAGGDDVVTAFHADSGKEVWSWAVTGRALCLAAADGALLVSTDQGYVYSFRPGAGDPTVRNAVSRTLHIRAAEGIVAEATEMALEAADTNRGFCLVLGLTDGSLAVEIARRSKFSVLCLEPDVEKVRAVREKLAHAGLYGTRVAVRPLDGDTRALPAYFANLIVSESGLETGRIPLAPERALRMLQPYGGTIVLGGRGGEPELSSWKIPGLGDWKRSTGEAGTWSVARRGALDGAGEWSHHFANLGGTTCSGDRLVGSPLGLQWFGPPYAEDVVERHSLAMPPLVTNGRMFVTGLYHTLRAMDAYNGTTLWKIEVPNMVRMNMSHNGAFIAAGADHLFAASRQTCRMIDAANGKTLHEFDALKKDRDWGFVGTRGNLLLGTDQKQPVKLKRSGEYSWGHANLYVANQLLSTPVVGDNFHAHDTPSGKVAWNHDKNTVILHQSIAASGDTVYFAESGNPKAVEHPGGSPELSDFTARLAAIVALDMRTGKKRWRKPLGPLSEKESDVYEHVLYLSVSDGKLLMTRSGHVDGLIGYRITQMDAGDGEVRWTQTISSEDKVYAPLSYGKNMQQNHPAIIGNRMYILAHQFRYICMDFETGEILRRDAFEGWQNSKTCAVPTASASGLFFRQSSAYMYDIAADQRIDLTRVTRPSCWMSMVPAAGLLLVPEASSGCTCGFALQMSMAFVPVEAAD